MTVLPLFSRMFPSSLMLSVPSSSLHSGEPSPTSSPPAAAPCSRSRSSLRACCPGSLAVRRSRSRTTSGRTRPRCRWRWAFGSRCRSSALSRNAVHARGRRDGDTRFRAAVAPSDKAILQRVLNRIFHGLPQRSLYSTLEKKKHGRRKKNLATTGFDPVTFGLWAQHASPAPSRFLTLGQDFFPAAQRRCAASSYIPLMYHLAGHTLSWFA